MINPIRTNWQVKILVLVTLVHLLRVSISPFCLHFARLNKLITFNHF